MFLALRICAFLAGYFIRFRSLFRGEASEVAHGERKFLKRVHQNKSRIVSSSVGMPVQHGVVFSLSKENRWDRLFKSLGLSCEMQARDSRFDEAVYVLSDNAAFGDFLRSSARFREAALGLIKLGARDVSCDGKVLWIAFSGDADAHDWADPLATLAEEIETLARLPRAPDPFVRRALIAEGVLWGLVGYGLGGVLELLFLDNPLYVHPNAVVFAGLKWALVGFALGLTAVFAAFRGSSHGHRLIMESVILLVILAPTVGITLVSELNRELDEATTVVLRPTVAGTRTEIRRSRRSTRTLYFVSVVPETLPKLPSEWQVSRSVFMGVHERPGARLRLEISPGYLGHAWFRRFSAERP
jgi:hypothetical protein